MDTEDKDKVHEVDIAQLKNAFTTIKKASMEKVEINYGIAGGAALAAAFGIAEYFSGKFSPGSSLPGGGENSTENKSGIVVNTDATAANNQDPNVIYDHEQSNDELLNTAESNKRDLEA